MQDSYNRSRHSITRLQVHLVFVVKYRKQVLQPEHHARLKGIFRDVGRKMNFSVVECDGEADHVHLLVTYPPQLPISKIVNHLKGVSSRLLRKEYGIRPHANHFWSPSYFAVSCGGAPIEVLKAYIQSQGKA